MYHNNCKVYIIERFDLTNNRNILDDDEFKQKCDEAFGSFEELDIANLLNEDLERSKNSLIYLTVFTLSLTVFTLEKFSFSGFEVSINENTGFLTYIFLLLLTAVLGVYYIVNSITDRISKLSKQHALEIRLSYFESYLTFVKVSVEKELKKPENKEDSDNRNIAEKLNVAQKNQLKKIKAYKSQLEVQQKRVAIVPYAIVFLCVIFEVIAIGIKTLIY